MLILRCVQGTGMKEMLRGARSFRAMIYIKGCDDQSDLIPLEVGIHCRRSRMFMIL